MDKRILITGAGGYIGSKMVLKYLEIGYFVIALDTYLFGDVFNDLSKNKQLTIIKDDTRSFKKALLKDVYAIIDLAAISNDPSSELNPKMTHEINTKSVSRVARLAKKMGVQKYIFSSSCSVYGGGKGTFDETSQTFPISTYAKSKIAAEKKLLTLTDNNFTVTIMRNGTVYGLSEKRMRFDLVVNVMTLHAWKQNKIYILGGGKQWRPLIHINDCINAFLSVLEEKDLRKIQKQIFNVGSNEQVLQVFEVANKIKEHFPNVIIENVPDDPDKRNYHANFSKIKNVLHFRPQKTVDDGIKEIKEALQKGTIEDTMRNRTFEYYQHLLSEKKLV